METGKDILELFFDALSTPKNSIVTELLSGNSVLDLTNTPEVRYTRGTTTTKGTKCF
jgi:hypothetical protein